MKPAPPVTRYRAIARWTSAKGCRAGPTRCRPAQHERGRKSRSQPVSRILSASATLRSLRRDDHSSSPAIARGLQRPTRWLRTGRPRAPPYLVLLRAGFCLPSVLPRTRCALTAPFHPYPSLGACAPRSGRYIFCATVRQVALPGRYPAHCPLEFGLSSRLRRWLRPTGCEACPPSPARKPAVVWLAATSYNYPVPPIPAPRIAERDLQTRASRDV